MKYPRYQVAISSGNLKSDYLYFDYLIPIYVPYEFPGTIPADLKGTETDFDIDDFTISDSRINPEIIRRLGKKRRADLKEMLNESYSEAAIAKKLAPAINELSRDISRAKYQPVPVLPSEINYGKAFTDFSAFSLISNNIVEIDTRNTTWKQLREFKSDKESKKALRKYRKFWYENYEGYSYAQIEDDLYNRIDALKSEVKKYGLNVFETVGKAIIKDSSVYTAGFATLVGVTLSGAVKAPENLVSGLSFAIAGISLSLLKSVSDKNQFLESSDIVYLYKVDSKLPTSKE